MVEPKEETYAEMMARLAIDDNDTDKDSKLNRAEFAQWATNILNELRDIEYSCISKPEDLAPISEEQIDKLFAEIDLSADGEIDKEEMNVFYSVTLEKKK